MMAPLRALDVSTGVGAAYAARLLAEVGWDVVKYEPESGDPLRRAASRWGSGEGGAFACANAGKRGVTCDENSLARLASEADVVIGDFSPAGLAEAGLSANSFDSLKPRSVIASVSAFGLTGPKADNVAAELIVQAASGLLFLTGEYDQPPMQLAPYQGALMGGVAAAAAAMAALRIARRHGSLQRVDVSMVEALASHTYASMSGYVYRGEVARREARLKGGLRMVPASDTFVYCAPGAVASMRMEGMAKLLDEPRLEEEKFQTAEGRMDNYDEFLSLFVPPFQRKTAKEWFDAAEAMHMTFALVQTIGDLLSCPQLGGRSFFREVEGPGGLPVWIPGRPFRLEGGPPAATRPPPARPGADNDAVIAEWLDSQAVRLLSTS
jgi:crotonobetainyl-CoA:carnitine CoA-transferase CaiB-like acyl-CoA transferase